jgi:hypothetical protein
VGDFSGPGASGSFPKSLLAAKGVAIQISTVWFRERKVPRERLGGPSTRGVETPAFGAPLTTHKNRESRPIRPDF